MNTQIDEQIAWSLLKSISPRLIEIDQSTRVYHHPKGDVWLQVHSSGQWKTSKPVTSAAHNLLELYLPLQIKADLVIAQIGQSLDGRIATISGNSHYVTGPADIQRLHRLRAIVDAVIVGARTIDSDNPYLTVRKVEGKNPVRVILDPNNTLDPKKNVFSDGKSKTLVVRKGSKNQDLRSAAKDNILLIPESSETGINELPPKNILQALHNLGYRRILVEGGGLTISRFLQAKALDRLHVTVAPLLIGSGLPSFTLNPIESLDQALRPRCRYFNLGKDILFDLELD